VSAGEEGKVTLARNEFDRLMGTFRDRNDTVWTREAVIRHVPWAAIGDGAKTFIVQTCRVRDFDGHGGSGDYVFIEQISVDGTGAAGTVRLVLTPDVSATIARQREAAGDKGRSLSARAAMKERMDAGFKPTPPPRRRRRS
jgi:hypothetical protein